MKLEEYEIQLSDNEKNYVSENLKIQVFEEIDRISNMEEFLLAVQNKQFSENAQMYIADAYNVLGDEVFKHLFITMNDETVIAYIKMLSSTFEKEQAIKEQELHQEAQKKEREKEQVIKEQERLALQNELQIKYLKIEINAFINEHLNLISKYNQTTYFNGLLQMASETDNLQVLEDISLKISSKYEVIKEKEKSFSEKLHHFLKTSTTKKKLFFKKDSKQFMNVFINHEQQFTKQELALLFEIFKTYNVAAEELHQFYLNYEKEENTLCKTK